jgi:ribosomal protein S19E (S16A)
MADGEIIGHKTRYSFWNEKGQSASDAVPQILVHAMHKDGLLTTDTEANEWRITHKGRQFLRRKQ